MPSILGLEAKLYINNAGTWALPVWLEVDLARDVELSMDKATADVTTRRSNGWRQQRGHLKEGEVTFQLLYSPGDTAFGLLQTAFLTNAIEIFYVADGDESVSGTEGLKAWFDITGFTIPQPLEEAMMVDVTLVTADTPAGEEPTWEVQP